MRINLAAWLPRQTACRRPHLLAGHCVPQRSLCYRPHCRTQPASFASPACLFSFPARRLLSTVASSIGSDAELDELRRWLASFGRDAIPYHSFTVHHARSSGAGGQNVNKVNTKVDMRFVLGSAAWLPSLLKRVLRQTEKGRINARDELIITSERHRTQGENVDDCKDKMYAILLKAAELDGETSAATIKRVEEHKRRAEAKRIAEKKFTKAKKADRRRRDE